MHYKDYSGYIQIFVCVVETVPMWHMQKNCEVSTLVDIPLDTALCKANIKTPKRENHWINYVIIMENVSWVQFFM